MKPKIPLLIFSLSFQDRGYYARKDRMSPIALARSRRFRDHELNEIERILIEHQDDILEACGIWFFSLMWEYGRDAEPVEFLDDRNILAETVRVL